ncbi:MAG: hypothetical protein ABIH38_01720 [Patescibacteria group bacterium]
MSEVEKKILLVIKIVFIAVPFLTFFWIVNQNYALTGLVKYVYHPDKYLASQIITLDQANLIQGVFQSDGKIHWQAADDSLKFTAKILRNFDQVKVKVDLNNISQPDVYLHAQGGVEKGEYHDLVSSQFLDQLTWPRLGKENLTLWQRPDRQSGEEGENAEAKKPVKQYQSIDEFQADLPSADKIGVFGLPAGQFSQFPGYQNNQEEREINHYFRGQHAIYFYKGDEPFRLSFKKIDLNRQVGSHVLNFKIYSGSELVYSRSVPAGQAGEAQEESVSQPDLARGFYRLYFDTNEDVIFGDIKTNIKYLYFYGHVFLADGKDYLAANPFKESVLLTDSASLTLETPHDSGINQNITIGRNQSVVYKTVSVKEKKHTYTADKLKGENYLTIPKTDILVTGGNFVFPGFDFVTGLIMPLEGKLAENKIEDLDYIVAAYAPKESQGLISYEKEYAFKDLFQKDKKIYFNIYSPGLYAGKLQLEIKKIEMTFTGQALTPAKIWEKAKLFINNTFK